MDIRLLNLGFALELDGTYRHYETGVQCERRADGLYNVVDLTGKVVHSCTIEYVMVILEEGLNDEQDI